MKKHYESPSVTAQIYGVNIIPAAAAALVASVASAAASSSALAGVATAAGLAGGYAIGRAATTAMELHMDYSNIGHLKKVMA